MMATQAALIAETIAGMKRTLSGKHESSDSDASVDRSTNRGNKLKRKSQFAHEGQLHRQKAYKKRIEHAGYSRYVLSKNPKQFDYYGEEIEDGDENDAADAVMVGDDPYGDLKVEAILKPLISAAELPNHPSLSYAYTSPVLEQMVKRACEMVRREERMLWQVKKLAMAFRGDPSRITGEETYSSTDSSLFEPGQVSLVLPLPVTQSQVISKNEHTTLVDRSDSHISLAEGDIQPIEQLLSDELKHGESTNIGPQYSLINEDVGGSNVKHAGKLVSRQTVADTKVPSSESNADMATDDKINTRLIPTDFIQPNDSDAHAQENEGKTPSHPMTTRAQAHVSSDKTVFSAPRSASPAFSESTSIHPIFQIMPSAIPNIDRALPPKEAEDTRTILFLWVQKQEEVVRGTVRMWESLLKANRMRKSVFEWCKAEGHLGEMSDGEDWYDKEEWGLDEGLRKGQEEEDDETVNQSKKTRGRRAQ